MFSTATAGIAPAPSQKYQSPGSPTIISSVPTKRLGAPTNASTRPGCKVPATRRVIPNGPRSDPNSHHTCRTDRIRGDRASLEVHSRLRQCLRPPSRARTKCIPDRLLSDNGECQAPMPSSSLSMQRAIGFASANVWRRRGRWRRSLFIAGGAVHRSPMLTTMRVSEGRRDEQVMETAIAPNASGRFSLPGGRCLPRLPEQ